MQTAVAQLELTFTVPTDPLGIARHYASSFRPGFADWLEDNLHVYCAVERLLDAQKAAGEDHGSMRQVVEDLRNRTNVTDTGEPWKLNGNHAPDLARLYVRRPGRAGFLQLRGRGVSEVH